MMRMRFIFFIVFCILEHTAFGQPLHWQKINEPPSIGNDKQSVALLGKTIFMNTVDNGVYRSTNNGDSWQNVVGDLGTRELFLVAGSTIFTQTSNAGVIRSTDNGDTWISKDTGIFGGAGFWDVHLLDANGTTVLAAWSGGLYRSTNSGDLWVTTATSPPNVTCMSFLGTTIFAGTRDSGVFRSVDNGDTWTPAASMINPHIRSLAVMEQTVFAGTDRNHLLRSRDSGKIWQDCSPSLWPYYSVSFLAVRGPTLLVGIIGGGGNVDAQFGLYRSIDDGNNWIHEDTSNVRSLAVSATNILVFTDDGLFLSDIHSNFVSPVRPDKDFRGRPTVYPNPFSEEAKIIFNSSDQGFAQITIVNLLGEEIAHIFSGELEVGEHTFQWNADGIPPGIYTCVIRTNSGIQELKMALMH